MRTSRSGHLATAPRIQRPVVNETARLSVDEGQCLTNLVILGHFARASASWSKHLFSAPNLFGSEESEVDTSEC